MFSNTNVLQFEYKSIFNKLLMALKMLKRQKVRSFVGSGQFCGSTASDKEGSKNCPS